MNMRNLGCHPINELHISAYIYFFQIIIIPSNDRVMLPIRKANFLDRHLKHFFFDVKKMWNRYFLSCFPFAKKVGAPKVYDTPKPKVIVTPSPKHVAATPKVISPPKQVKHQVILLEELNCSSQPPPKKKNKIKKWVSKKAQRIAKAFQKKPMIQERNLIPLVPFENQGRKDRVKEWREKICQDEIRKSFPEHAHFFVDNMLVTSTNLQNFIDDHPEMNTYSNGDYTQSEIVLKILQQLKSQSI